MKTLKAAACMLAVFAAGFLSGRLLWTAHVPEHITKTVTDTLTVRDTVVFDRPVPKYVHTVDTMLVFMKDTVMVHDTAFVVLPRERKVYEDSAYMAVVSGYRPSLDSICVYPETRVISTVQTVCVASRKRWGIGVQAGYGAHVHDGRICPAPYVGVGISYDLIRW